MNRGFFTRFLSLRWLWRAICVAQFCAIAQLSSPVVAQTQSVAVAAAESRVVIIAPLQLIKAEDLNFGKIAAGNAAGTVTVDAATGACTTTGPIVQIGGCTRANFVGMGNRNSLVGIRINGITQLTGSGAPMTLSNLNIVGAPDLGFFFSFAGIGIYRINAPTGIFDFSVGGRLNVNANQSPGVYNGTFVVRIDYF